MNRLQIGQFNMNPNQMQNSFATQSNADSVGMASSINDIGVYHPHIHNQQHIHRLHPAENMYQENYQSKGSDGGFAGTKQSMWTPDEDTTLVRLVEKIGPQKWALIADYLPNRQGKHCRERWHNHLNPRNKRCEWTKIEEWVLFLLHRKLENQWAQIAKVLEGRTDNSIKNHWNSSMRKKKTDMQRALDSYITQMLKVRKVNVETLDAKVLKQKKEEIENKYLLELRREVGSENKKYYEQKAKEMMRRQDGSIFLQICTRLLVQSVPGLQEEELLAMVKMEQGQNKEEKNKKKEEEHSSESFDTKFKNSIQNRMYEGEQQDQMNEAKKQEDQSLNEAQEHDSELKDLRLADDKKSLKRDKPSQEHDELVQQSDNASSLLQRQRINKCNAKTNMFAPMMEKESDLQGNLKRAKLNEDIQTGSTYPYSMNKENMESMRPFQNMHEQALMDIAGNANQCMPLNEKEEDVYKTPEQTVKQAKTVTSLLRNESPDYANRGGNISSDDQERNGKRSDGTYYINNITNNIIVDKNRQEQRKNQLLQSSTKDKRHQADEAACQEKSCSCHLKFLDKSDPRFPTSLQRNMLNHPGMPNLNQFPPYFLQMMEWYHVEMMKQYQVHGKGQPASHGAQGSRNNSANCSCPSDGNQQNQQQCSCPVKHGSFHLPPPPTPFNLPAISSMNRFLGQDASQDHQGMDKHNFEKLSFVSPLQTSKKKWRDFDCHGGEQKPSDAVGPRPFNLQSSSKKRDLSLDAGRQFSRQEDKENQHNQANGDDQARQQKMPLQVNVAQREHTNSLANLSNSKGTYGHAPTPAFSAAFKSPELDLSAKQPHNALNKLSQYSINKFENLNSLREKQASKQGSQGSEIHQIDSFKASIAMPAPASNSKDNEE